jgi:tRNA(fMet)-specific endonuclease VapC
VRYLLDTNVISETMRAASNRHLLGALARHDGQFGISAVTWHELAFGVRRLPKGARRVALEVRLQDLARDLPPPLPFTAEAGDWLATERARLEAKGVSITTEDGMIAATAYVSSLTVVTANTKHFEPFLGLRVVDWSRPAGPYPSSRPCGGQRDT